MKVLQDIILSVCKGFDFKLGIFIDRYSPYSKVFVIRLVSTSNRSLLSCQSSSASHYGTSDAEAIGEVSKNYAITKDHTTPND